jgi:hypothetical protein
VQPIRPRCRTRSCILSRRTPRLYWFKAARAAITSVIGRDAVTQPIARITETTDTDTEGAAMATMLVPRARIQTLMTAAVCGVEACVVRLATMHWAAAACRTISSRVSAHGGTELVIIVYANPR